MIAPPRRPTFVVVAALVAIVVPVSNACASLPGSSGSKAARTVAYLARPPAGAPQGVGQLSTLRPKAPRWVTTTTGSQVGWVELGASASAPGATTTDATPPSGHGYLWTSDSLAGQTVAAGSWTPEVTLKARGSLTVVPRVRVYQRAAGRYRLIATSTGRASKLGSSSRTLKLPTVQAGRVAFASGARLYVDLSVRIATAGRAGDGVLHEDNAGTAAAVTFPQHAATVGSPTAAPPVSPSPPTTTPPTPPTPPTVSPPVAAGVWKPRPGTTWQWQITGKVDTSAAVDMYDIDLFDAQTAASSYTVPGFGTVNVPQGENAGVIDTLHARGIVVICYLDTGAYESYRPDAALFPSSVIGASTGWSDEKWLDLRPASWSQFEPLIAARLDLAKRSGCDGVEPDENNPLGNKPGFPISTADQKAWYLEIARLAHARALSVGQKNGIETTDADTIAAFDWDLNEECNKYSECAVLDGYIAAGKAVFQVEYQDEGMSAAMFCAADNTQHFDGLLKKLELGAWRVAC